METAIVFLPLLGAIIAGLFGRTNWGSSLTVRNSRLTWLLSAVLSWVVFLGFAGAHDQPNRSHTVQLVDAGLLRVISSSGLGAANRYADRRDARGCHNRVSRRAHLLRWLHGRRSVQSHDLWLTSAFSPSPC